MQETDYVKHHIQKVPGVLSDAKFASDLKAKNHNVILF
jgi:hypothetical protein